MTVVVVGGGIVGMAAAHSLAERGVSVVLCEKGSVGAGSTERSAGGIRTQFSTRVNVRLSLASIDVWESFEDEFGVDIEYRRSGYLFLARDEATADDFEANVAMQREEGVDSELLAPEDAREHCPGLDPEPFRAATYCPTDGFADPHLALQGYSQAAAEAGVDVRTKTPVTAVHRDDDGRVTGVETSDDTIEAEYVVNAAGPWAGRLNELAGVALPVVPKRRQVAVVDPETPVPESVPLTIDLDTGSYFRPEREGAALVGGHFGGDDPDVDPDRFSTTADTDWTIEAVEHAADYASYFGPETRIKNGWAGLYAVTPDHHPIVEEVAPGYLTAIGFSGHGFQHAPATGQIIADLVVDGETDLVDLDALSADRFERGETHDEQNVA
ncbi:NAD(P)/FAD-dependent oxidoreductase [Haloarchaeobius baliensis]|uniref:NAD(P)/FAD-dependent oxidoreductase n=1 Tax=Haloarchaeobius baliensis TaxID=1670458 RepID=UPI003F883AA0